ncbi:MAG: glycosyl transferase family 2 [Cardiobacteriaceae bacterium]|nr:glycosyl transferase family 2 [Cardiobacteriaceae bacterium]
MNGLNKQNKVHWALEKERGSYFFLKLTLILVRYLPLFICYFFVYIVCIYFYISSRQLRKNILHYQNNLNKTFPENNLPKKFPIFLQVVNFGTSIVDRFAVWSGKIAHKNLLISDPDGIMERLTNNKRGEIFICSHLGNLDVLRGFLHIYPEFKLNILHHSQNAKMFNRVLEESGAENIRLIQVSELDADFMLKLSNKLEQGEWIVIAADRIPLSGNKYCSVKFLGEEANFPTGSWLLASILKAPTNTIFALKEKSKFRLILRNFSSVEDIRNKRKNFTPLIEKYSTVLAEIAREYPLQWFNFFDFWQQGRENK